MGFLSLGLTVVGIAGMLVHFATHSICLGIVTALAFVAAYVTGTMEMKRQSANGGIRVDMFNPALLGHGMSGTLLVVGAIMCILSNVL